MTAQKMVSCYSIFKILTNLSFEQLYESRKINNFEHAIMQFPFLVEEFWYLYNGDCILEQCVAIEKGWA